VNLQRQSKMRNPCILWLWLLRSHLLS
jgi:hypothetical protein